jgi:hypothetical protein
MSAIVTLLLGGRHTGNFVGVDDGKDSGTFLVACGLEFRHGHGVHIDSSGLSDEVNDCYSRHQRVGSFGS